MATTRKNGGKWITQENRLAIYVRDNCKCVYCGSSEDLSLDHIVCHSHNGSDSHNNLVTCCRSCNSKRGNKSIELFATCEQITKILYLVSQDIKLYKKLSNALIKEYKYSQSLIIVKECAK